MLTLLLCFLCMLVLPSRGMPACEQNVEVCEFTLEAELKLTMMYGKILTYAEDGNLYDYRVTNTSSAEPIPSAEVITGDGYEMPRMVFVFNGQFPGPPIEVWENQMVKVKVVNKLKNDGITIHWHGLHQAGTPFMDGVPFVSQCPILPEQTFIYLFKAYPKGTFWYHSHMGSQRTMGLYGPIIIHERKPIYPGLQEFTWTITDWNHDYDSEMAYYKMVYGIYEGRSKIKGTGSLDGSFFSMFRYHSGLLNGKGRYHNPVTGKHNGAPLSVFNVTGGSSYRVRVIAAGELYPFRVSVDQHLITIIASDGYYLEPVTVESFIINPGERFDFIINATQTVDNYWIRGETLEVGMNHTLEAILHYDGAPVNMDPTSQPANCTMDSMCVVVNCPFTYYPMEDYTKCITFDSLRSLEVQKTPLKSDGMFQEQFLNFAFPGNKWTPGSINGIAYQQPVVSALTQPHEIDTQCTQDDCGEDKVCQCTWALPLHHAQTYQFVFLNMGSGKGWSHPIHMHGHSFYVLKMGYARYNETTAKLIGDNLDIDCRGNPDRTKSFCNNATWTNSSWLHGNVPDVELEKPPRKDTLIVPTGGYAVIRIKADNPGIWTLHCHIQIHNMDGMVMLLNESYSETPKIPNNFPSCRNYHGHHTADEEATSTAPVTTKVTPMLSTTTVKSTDNQMLCREMMGVYTKELFWGVVGCLIGIVALLFFILLVYMGLHRPRYGRGYTLEPVPGRLGFDNKGSDF
ncbi:uncharacterized protein LOC135470287 [Liolophura sinensis]|uniref:uncharacterized protein LOC135470287 n=1 Tax=Liolophura sinensis TaxID=3198878 RepID=UPI0031596BEA